MAMTEEIACHAPCGCDAVRYGLRQAADTISRSRPERATPIALSSREEKLERAKGFEPSTPTLARSCSTPELHPHPLEIVAWLSPATADLCQMRTANATASNGRLKVAQRP